MLRIIDDFVDRLADDIGVALSLSGEPLPLVDRFVNACLSDESGKWITIGGKPEGDKGKHVGGFRVQINGDGKIIKGRLKGTNVKDVKKRFDEKNNRGTPIREKEEGTRMPPFMKNQKSEDSVKNTVDNSRKDAIISPVGKENTNAKGDKMDAAKKYSVLNSVVMFGKEGRELSSFGSRADDVKELVDEGYLEVNDGIVKVTSKAMISGETKVGDVVVGENWQIACWSRQVGRQRASVVRVF